jgi:hypothetical protein
VINIKDYISIKYIECIRSWLIVEYLVTSKTILHIKKPVESQANSSIYTIKVSINLFT